MQPEKPTYTTSAASSENSADLVAAEPSLADAEYDAFLAFQDIGAKNSERALGGRVARRPRKL